MGGATWLTICLLLAALVYLIGARRRAERGATPAAVPIREPGTFESGWSLRGRIHGFDDGPSELEAQLPLEGSFVRLLRAPDGQDYSLFLLDRPVEWRGKARPYLILLPATVGGQIGTGARSLFVNVAVAKDDSLRTATTMVWSDADPAAKGYLATAARASKGLSRDEKILDPVR